MTNFYVGITAYERPQGLMRLLTLLHQQRGVRTDVHVAYDSPSPPETITSLVDGKGTLHLPREHMGRDGYWRLVNLLWDEARRHRAEWDLFLFVQDDVAFSDPYFLERIGETLEVARERMVNIASLNLYGDGPNHDPVARWTGAPVVPTVEGLVSANWTDMVCVAFTRLAVSFVPCLFAPVPIQERDGNSSGVGRQISRTLYDARTLQLMVEEPWVEHADGGKSKMHPNRVTQQPYA